MSIDEQAGPILTGDDRVDQVLTALDTLEDRPVHEHVEVFESVLAGLRDSLDGPASA